MGGVSGSVQNGPKRWHTTRAQNSVSGTPQIMSISCAMFQQFVMLINPPILLV